MGPVTVLPSTANRVSDTYGRIIAQELKIKQLVIGKNHKFATVILLFMVIVLAFEPESGGAA